ncbi:uncharacterized protein LOC123531737 isoform X2 [Mercenaria mercenaria]|uniref:uncharacterized protein LOC123531737 isoform X2 n=1 Tax=Mercenaria mercenaria TaxID=6596 RepID=UPI00234EEEC7|nr:uncharacterized protein LOC123531737 isoform X2 [Mercenaria mercenaria]
MATRKRKTRSVSDVTDDVSTCTSNGQGELLQMRLLQTDEKYRSRFLYDQIQSFEDKVYRSYEQFSVDLLHRMFLSLSKRTVVDARKVKTIANLRKCFLDLKNLIRCKLRHRHVRTTPEEEKLVNYFTWFFKYLDYLRKLRANFVERIFSPLFRYFYLVGYDLPDRENTPDSIVSSPSVLSFRSIDSGYSDVSGLTLTLAEGGRLSGSTSAQSGFHETQEARRRLVTKQALISLGREFRDIKKLYDTSEMEKLAQRLSHLKERTDHLLDQENSLDQQLLCQDSERSVFHLKVANFGNEKVLRFVPDILLKFQKAAWLARRWLEQDDQKTKDLNVKLEKLTQLEENMNRKLSSLSKEIQLKELELESKADLLNNLLERENRSNSLSQSVYDLEKRKGVLTEKVTVLNSERVQLCEKITAAVKREDRKAYKQLKAFYDKNKLQRFAVERQIANIDYHINLAESDMNIELELKADVIHTTNDVQDKCEEIEQRLEKAKKEQKIIQAALIPISEDRKFVKEQLQAEEGFTVGDDKPALRAEFINSVAYDPDRVVDLNSEYIGHRAIGNPLSLLITSLPEGGHVSSKPVQIQKNKSLPQVNSSKVDNVPQTTKVIDSMASLHRQLYTPEVMASEW